jgi:DNA/RNA-binding domain of Phe-tRNA-synthetase-like protein
MRVVIDPELKRRCPRTALGCVTAQVITGASPEELTAELRSREEEILQLADPAAVLAAPEIRATREAYKALGKDPARYRGSAEALLRRIVAGKGLPRINAVVDVINLVSVESRMPLGLYDLDKLSGDVTFRAGRAGETYKGIGKYDLNLEGLPVFSDESSPFGSPTSDSERTMVTLETRGVLAVIIAFSGEDGLGGWPARTVDLLARHAAGRDFSIETVR